MGASNQFGKCGVRSGPKRGSIPDIQYHFLPIAVRYDGQAAARGAGFQAHVGPMRCHVARSVTLASGAQRRAQDFFQHMSQEKDWEEFAIALASPRDLAAGTRFNLRQTRDPARG